MVGQIEDMERAALLAELEDLALDPMDLHAAAVAESMAEFWRFAWPIVEPGTPLKWNWHIDAICEHLEAVTDRLIRYLVIMIPPGLAKSLGVSVFWPAWEWLKRPEERSLFASHSPDVTTRDSIRCRRIIRDPAYVDVADRVADMRGEPRWRLQKDRARIKVFENTRQGFRQILTVNSEGGTTGNRGDKIVTDDPVDVKKATHGAPAKVRATMDSINKWYDKVYCSRLADKATGPQVLIMQCVHEQDLAAHVARTRKDCVVLCLPQEYQPTHRWHYVGDPRTVEGELLCPDIYPREVLEEIKTVELGLRDYEAQHQQNPMPAEGNLFKAYHVKNMDLEGQPWREDRFYRAPIREMADTCEEIGLFVDASFKKTATSDPVGLLAIGRRGPKKILLGRVHDRMGFVQTCATFERAVREWPDALIKVIEVKANGDALVDVYEEHLHGLVEFNPNSFRGKNWGDKWQRAQLTAREWEAGDWLWPHPDVYPWCADYMHFMLGFDAAAYDEDVDCSSMATIYWLETDAGGRDDKATADVLKKIRIGRFGGMY